MSETTTKKPMTEKARLARNVHEGWQIKDLETGEWLTVKLALHITAPLQVSSFTFTDGTEASMHPRQQVFCRRH